MQHCWISHETRALFASEKTPSNTHINVCIVVKFESLLCFYLFVRFAMHSAAPGPPKNQKNHFQSLRNCFACMRIGCGCQLNAHLLHMLLYAIGLKNPISHFSLIENDVRQYVSSSNVAILFALQYSMHDSKH